MVDKQLDFDDGFDLNEAEMDAMAEYFASNRFSVDFIDGNEMWGLECNGVELFFTILKGLSQGGPDAIAKVSLLS